MIPRTDHQAFDLAPYSSQFSSEPGLRLRDLSSPDGQISLTIKDIGDTFRSLSAKNKITASITLVLFPILFFGSIIRNYYPILFSQETPLEDQTYPFVAVQYLLLVPALWVSSKLVYSNRKNELTSNAIRYYHNGFFTTDINRMNLMQFFELLRDWENFTTTHWQKVIGFEPKKMFITYKVELWRRMTFEQYHSLFSEKLPSIRQVLQEHPYLYPFLVHHLPENLKTMEYLLQRVNPALLLSDTIDCFSPFEELHQEHCVAASSVPVPEPITVSFKDQPDTLIVDRDLLVSKSGYFKQFLKGNTIQFDQIKREEFQILMDFLRHGEEAIDETNCILLYDLASFYLLDDEEILLILKYVANQIHILDDTFYKKDRIVPFIKSPNEKLAIDSILDTLEEVLFRSDNTEILKKIKQFLRYINQAKAYVKLIQNVQQSIMNKLDNELVLEIREFASIINVSRIITSEKVLKDIQNKLYQHFASTNFYNEFPLYPVNVLWDWATEQNHQDFKQIIADFCATPESINNIQKTLQNQNRSHLSIELQEIMFHTLMKQRTSEASVGNSTNFFDDFVLNDAGI